MILKERLSDREDNDEPDTTVIELFSSACFPQHIILYYAISARERIEISPGYVPFEDKTNYDGIQRRNVGQLEFFTSF